MASTADSVVPCAVIRMTVVSGRELAHLVEQLEARHARHADVADHQVPVVALEGDQRLAGRATGADVVTVALQEDLEELLHAGLVVDDQDPRQSPLLDGRSESRSTRLRIRRWAGTLAPSCPCPRSLATADASAVRLDHAVHGREAEPGALGLGGEERLEDALERRRARCRSRDPRPRSRARPRPRRARARTRTTRSAGSLCAALQHQVPEHLAELVGVAERAQLVAERRARPRRRARVARDELGELLEQRAQRDRLEAPGAGARVGQEVA